MEYRRLGRSGLKVSEISLGSWLTFGKSVDERTAINTIHKAYDLGVNFFDSANVYENGEAERVMASALRDLPRSSYILTTKAYCPVGTGVNDRGLSRKHIIEQVNSSLSRMKLDYVDIFYCHRYDYETPVDETLRAIDDLIRQGKILYAGVSEWTAAQISESIRVADRYLLDQIIVNQTQYHLLHRQIEHEVIPVSAKHGISQVVSSPLAQGILTGKYQGGNIPYGSRAANQEINSYVKNIMTNIVMTKVERLQELANEVDLSLPVLALAWILRNENVASTVVGASAPDQIELNVTASGVVLSDDTIQRIERILT
jgi:voltage-dependent potassium channel beta subunit